MPNTERKMKFSVKGFFSKYDQIRSFLRIWSHLLKKSLLENFNFQCSQSTSCLKSNKAHGYDKINIRVLEICGDTICLSLAIIFRQCFEKGVFPSIWKKIFIIVLIYKKRNKRYLKNYLSVPLLPICGKSLKRLVFNEMFLFSLGNLENNLIKSNQSGFKQS